MGLGRASAKKCVRGCGLIYRCHLPFFLSESAKAVIAFCRQFNGGAKIKCLMWVLSKSDAHRPDLALFGNFAPGLTTTSRRSRERRRSSLLTSPGEPRRR